MKVSVFDHFDLPKMGVPYKSVCPGLLSGCCCPGVWAGVGGVVQRQGNVAGTAVCDLLGAAVSAESYLLLPSPCPLNWVGLLRRVSKTPIV